jgi:hypothetical protein
MRGKVTKRRGKIPCTAGQIIFPKTIGRDHVSNAAATSTEVVLRHEGLAGAESRAWPEHGWMATSTTGQQ